jgi:hypothetical protein
VTPARIAQLRQEATRIHAVFAEGVPLVAGDSMLIPTGEVLALCERAASAPGDNLAGAVQAFVEVCAGTAPSWATSWPQWSSAPGEADPFTAQDVRDETQPILDALPALWAALAEYREAS